MRIIILNRLKELIIIEMDYFKQKIYEISGVPKSYLEEIDEEPISKEDAKVERRFEKFIGRLIKTKSNKSI